MKPLPPMLRDTATAVALCAMALPAWATSYVVDTTADVIAVDGQISLREAITAANTNSASGDAPAGEVDGDSITFAVGIDTITLVGALPDITDDLAITGPVTLDGSATAPNGIVGVNTNGGGAEPVVFGNLVFANGSATSGGALGV